MGEHEILRILNGFLGSKALMTAHEVGLFVTIDRSRGTISEIVAASGLAPRPTKILVQALIGLELLSCDGNGIISVPNHLQPILCQRDGFLTTRYLLEFYQDVFDACTEMTEIVRNDSTERHFAPRDYFREDVNSVDAETARDYSAYMEATMSKIAEVVLDTYDFSEIVRALDICGGPGTFARKLAEAHDDLQAWFLDIPAVVASGEKLRAASSASERITAIPGDAFTTELPDAQLITFCRSAHDWSDEKIAPLFERAHAALEPQGKLLLIERMVPAIPDPQFANLYLRAMYFIIKSSSASYRSPQDYETMLRPMGFKAFRVLRPREDAYPSFWGLHLFEATKA